GALRPGCPRLPADRARPGRERPAAAGLAAVPRPLLPRSQRAGRLRRRRRARRLRQARGLRRRRGRHGRDPRAPLPGATMTDTDTDLVAELRSTFLFEGLDAEQLDFVAAHGVEVAFDAGVRVF